MARKGNDVVVVTDTDTLDLGGLTTLPMEALRKQGPIDANGRAMVLADVRHKVTQLIDGKSVTFTVTLYAQRDALSEAEIAKVAAVKADKDAKAETRKREDQEKREREIAEASRRSIEGVTAGLKIMADIGPQLQKSAAIARAVGLAE